MKKLLYGLAVVILSLLCMTACKKESNYEPRFEVGEGYTLSADVISGTVVGEEYIDLFSVFTTYEDFIIFGDSTAETFLESGIIPLKKGNNHLVIRFMRDGAEREYDLKIEYIPIRSFSVEVLNADKTYHIGERFDQSTIRVWGVTESGDMVEVENYTLEYEFSELGEADVGIELGDFYKSISVMITEEYLPTLDGKFSADGVSYTLRGEEAVLLSAEDIEGFFAVPRAVVYDGKEYPVTEIGNGAFARTNITGVLISEGVKKLASGVFSGCEYLEYAELPETLEVMGRQVFSDCISLRYIALPEGITRLEYGAFLGCESLFRAELPETLTVIDEKAFSGCKALKTLQFPKNLSEIGAEAFSECTALTSVILPNLQKIGDEAFADCKALTAFALADAVSLGEKLFDGADVTVYTSMTGRVLSYVARENIPYVTVGADEPCIVRLPEHFAIEDDYPYHEIFAMILSENGISALSDYEVKFAKDACGYLTATLTWGDFSHAYEIFVSYTETVLTDTDTRGARYELDPITKTATLVSLPEYVRPSKIYTPEQDGLFLVPTALSCPDGVYTVVDVKEDADLHCQNVSEILVPLMTKNV